MQRNAAGGAFNEVFATLFAIEMQLLLKLSNEGPLPPTEAPHNLEEITAMLQAGAAAQQLLQRHAEHHVPHFHGAADRQHEHECITPIPRIEVLLIPAGPGHQHLVCVVPLGRPAAHPRRI
jgi:hypothetical protein